MASPPTELGPISSTTNSAPLIAPNRGHQLTSAVRIVARGDATDQVRKLKEEFDGELQVPGSHRLVQELITSDLVDQINLMVFPVVLGTGKKVFEEKPERRNMMLKESKVVGDGVLVLIYERAADRG